MNLGNVYQDWGQYAKAVEYYEKSLQIFKKIGNVKGEGQSLGNLGNVYRGWGQYPKAVEYYEKSLQIFKKVGDVKGEGSTLNNLGNVYKGWGQYPKAVEYYEKSLQIDRKLGDVKGEGQSLGNLGIVYYGWGQYAKALEYFEKSMEIKRKIGDVAGEGDALLNLGSVYKGWGQYAKAIEYYEKSLEISRKIGDVKGEGGALHNLGSVNKGWGQYAKAIEYYEKSLEIMRKIGDVKSEGSSLHNLGLVYRDWGQYAKAVEYYEKSLQIFKKIGDVKGEGSSLMGLGEVYRHLGEHDKALASFQKGLEIYVKIGVPIDRPNDLIGNLYLDSGDLAKAEPFIKQANYTSSLGRLYLVKADYPSAKNSYESLLKSAQQNRDANDLFTAYAGLGISYEGIGDNTQAVEYYRKAVAHTEDLRSSLNPTERETFFDVRIGGFYRTAPYDGLARVLAKMNRPVEALKESEYTRARIFAESISKRSEYAGLDVPKDIRDKDSQLTDELAALTKNLQKAYEKQNKEQITVLEPQVKEAKQKLSAHVDMLRKHYPLFAATKYPQPMDLKETALQDNEWVLAYHVTDPGVIIYLTKGRSLIKGLFKPIPRKDVDELVRNFRSPMELGPGDSFTEKLSKFDFGSGKKLTDILLSEILPDIPKNTPVIIIPDGSLGVVPFEMLVLNDAGKIITDNKKPQTSGAEFFGDRNPISYYQSITALTLARTLGKQKKAQDKLLVIADPVFDKMDVRTQETGSSTKPTGAEARMYKGLMVAIEEGELGGLRLKQLPLTGNLAENLNTAFKGSCALYTGLKADKGAFMKDIAPNLGDYSKIVFATHGYFGKGLPGINEPVLVFTLVPPGKDGYLRMSEVMGLKMNADMVALTACQTGLGKNISGEGTMGMGRAFQYAGAKSVLMSLWSVEVGSSVDLVEGFFRNIKEGKNKLEALKLARDEIRKQGYDHPFFWASFILVGECENQSPPAAVSSNPTPVSFKNSALRDEEYVVTLDVSSESVGVKLIHEKEVKRSFLCDLKSGDLERDIAKLREGLNGRSLKSYDPELAKSLYNKLLRPVLADVPKGAPLIIVADGILEWLPFEVLVTGGEATWKSGQWGDYPEGLTFFADEHPISYYHSITALNRIRTSVAKNKPNDQLLIVADPVFEMRDSRINQSGAIKAPEENKTTVYQDIVSKNEARPKSMRFSRLAQTSVLADNLKNIYGSNCLALTGLDASKETFLSKIDQFGNIVLATHGVFSDKPHGIMEPFLALTMVPPGVDGFLKMSEILSVKMNAEVLALTIWPGFSVDRFASGGIIKTCSDLQFAGARSVLTGLLPLAETSTAKFLEDFFKYRKEGKTKLQALQAARNNLRNAGFQHPFFWASFILVGEAN